MNYPFSNRVLSLKCVRVLIFFSVVIVQAACAQAQEITTYTYDELGRLEVVDLGPDEEVNLRRIEYGLDAAGNRTHVDVVYADQWETNGGVFGGKAIDAQVSYMPTPAGVIVVVIPASQ